MSQELLGQPVTALELAAFVTGLAAVWLTKQRHIWNWPVSLVNVACFMVLFHEAKLYADALLQLAFAVLSLLATWWQVLRRLECWVAWIVVDLVSIPLYWQRGLPLTALLYGIFLLICVAGFVDWRRAWQGRAQPRDDAVAGA